MKKAKHLIKDTVAFGIRIETKDRQSIEAIAESLGLPPTVWVRMIIKKELAKNGL